MGGQKKEDMNLRKRSTVQKSKYNLHKPQNGKVK